MLIEELFVRLPHKHQLAKCQVTRMNCFSTHPNAINPVIQSRQKPFRVREPADGSSGYIVGVVFVPPFEQDLARLLVVQKTVVSRLHT